MRAFRSALGLLTFVFHAGITLVVGVVATPYLLRWLGEERFGAFRLAMDWQGYIGLLEFGIAGALLPFLGSKHESTEKVLGASINTYLKITALMLAVSFVAFFFLNHLIPVAPELQNDLRNSWIIGTGLLLAIPLTPFRLLLDATQRSYWGNLLQTMQYLVATVLALLLAYYGLGIAGQFVAHGTGILMLFLLAGLWGLRRHPGSLKHIFVHNEYRSKIWNLNWPVFTINLTGRISILTDNIIIGLIQGPLFVVPFLLTQRLPMVIQGQLQGFGHVSWAGLAELYHDGHKDIFNERLLELTKLVATAGVAFLVPIAFFNQSFVSLWVGPERFGGELLNWSTMLAVFLQAIFSLWGWSLFSLGLASVMVPVAVISAIVNLVSSVFLTTQFGIAGPVLGSLVAFLLVHLGGYLALLNRHFGVSPLSLGGTLVRPIAVSIPLIFTLTRISPPQSWTGLIWNLFWPFAAYSVLAWLFVFNLNERKRWKDRFTNWKGVITADRS